MSQWVCKLDHENTSVILAKLQEFFQGATMKVPEPGNGTFH